MFAQESHAKMNRTRFRTENNKPTNIMNTEISTDLYFLIYKFLMDGPFSKTVKSFKDELEEIGALSSRQDWTGNKHKKTLDHLQQQFPSVRHDYLYQLCCRAGVVNQQSPNKVITIFSLNGKFKRDYNFRQLNDYTRRQHLLPVRTKALHNNLVNILRGRELSGPVAKQWMITPKLYNEFQFHRRTLGHLCAVYCILFDRTGHYLITGADDLLIKLWSTHSGRLIHTFRGASSEITDIAVSVENTLLAAGSTDRILRIWSLHSGAPVAVLTGHTGMITSVKFCPSPSWDLQYLVTTSTDGSVAFWGYVNELNGNVEFRNKPIMYQEKMRPGQAQMICSSFSPGGTFLATGSADHHVRVYYMKGDEGPHRILEVEAHDDRVDSMQWAHSGLRFVSGSKDGTAIIWTFQSQQWKSLYLRMTTKLPGEKESVDDPKKLKVTMVAWDYSDTWVTTAVSDYTLKVWNSCSGSLVKVLTGHTDEVYVLEPHPYAENVILSAGHDGQLFIWNIQNGETIFCFRNTIEGQGNGALFDVRWSPDGTSLGASDSHGHLIILGYGKNNPLYEQLPKELFFHTDYRPLVRDANNYVLDEQTQIPPHLMPPPFLVDIDGNPYPPMLQRLVPGREHCKSEQLVPSVILGNGGNQEVVQVVLDESHRVGEGNDPSPNGIPRNHFISSRAQPLRLRDTEGIRYCSGDWQKDTNIKWKKYDLIPHLRSTEIKCVKDQIEFFEEREMKEYQRQLCQRPVMINTNNTSMSQKNTEKKTRISAKRGRQFPRYQQQAVLIYPTDESSIGEEESEISDSSGYSDWIVDENVAVETPTTRRRRRQQVNYNTDSDHHNEHDNDDDVSKVTKTTPQKAKSTTRVPRKKDIPDAYRTNEWLTEIKPRKTPYFPQIGDVLVYFIQGHQLYLDAVRAKDIYEINNKSAPWNKFPLQSHELIKVISIDYEIVPPRVCCLKLALLDHNGRLTGKVFSIRYHDMPDVLDFFILKQYFDVAISRDWNDGDRFRCLIDDGWWTGVVFSKTALDDDHPNSYFMCYEIKWDNGEVERMSPWDMEPIPENFNSETAGEPIPLLPEELRSILYRPIAEDWPNSDRDTTCAYIVSGITKVMELAIAEPFLVPVDLSVYPTYAFIVEYPIDLSSIKSRLESRFYRRIAAVQFDIRRLAINAEKFNERHSNIVKHAKILTELCLRVIKQCSTYVDVNALYHQLVDTYDSSETDVDVEVVPSNSRMLRSLPNRYLKRPSNWRSPAKTLLDGMFNCEDSAPFRNPVILSKYPDYLQVISTPMDLSTVRQKLNSKVYQSPHDFKNDMRQIFLNSRKYNTNKRSRIYVMTVRLSAIFEEHMSKIIQNWNIAKRRSTRSQTSNHTALSNNSQQSSLAANSDLQDENSTDEDSTPDSENSSAASDSAHNVNQRVTRSRNTASTSSKTSHCTNNNNSDDSTAFHSRRKRKLRRVASSSDNTDDNTDDRKSLDSTEGRRRCKRVARKCVSTRMDLSGTSSDDSQEDSNSEDVSDADANVQFTTVSSRGRVRKLTARARALMRK